MLNETTLAQQKQQAIKDAFAGWVWKDPQRRALLVKKYNELLTEMCIRDSDHPSKGYHQKSHGESFLAIAQDYICLLYTSIIPQHPLQCD